jgi:hypothetical protein
MVNVDDLSGFTKILLTQIVPFLGCVLALTVFSAPMIAVLRVWGLDCRSKMHNCPPCFPPGLSCAIRSSQARRTGRLGEINPVPYPCMVGNTIGNDSAAA